MIYTNVDPDVILLVSSAGGTYSLDLNNDGMVDFRLVAVTGGSAKLLGVMMVPYSTGNLNAIAGGYGLIGDTVIGYPYAIAPDETINNNLKFLDFKLLANDYNQFVFPAMASTGNNQSYGNWKGGITDHFLGLKFSIDHINYHFGWVRCDVDSDNNSITIKDYAYQQTSYAALLTGDGIQTGMGPADPSLHFNILSYEGVVNVFINDGKLDDATIAITNMTGATILKKEISNRITRIDLNPFSKGIYMVTLRRGSEVFLKKVSFR